MKAAVVYSTLTGNTKKVAEAVLEGLGDGAEIFDVNAAPDPSDIDVSETAATVGADDTDAKAEAQAVIDAQSGATTHDYGTGPYSVSWTDSEWDELKVFCGNRRSSGDSLVSPVDFTTGAVTPYIKDKGAFFMELLNKDTACP